jgi:hypothetical protein
MGVKQAGPRLLLLVLVQPHLLMNLVNAGCSCFTVSSAASSMASAAFSVTRSAVVAKPALAALFKLEIALNVTPCP